MKGWFFKGKRGVTGYVNNFGIYEEAYGSVAAVIILMLWLNLTSFVILPGAELNAEMEHQLAPTRPSVKGNPWVALSMPTRWHGATRDRERKH